MNFDQKYGLNFNMEKDDDFYCDYNQQKKHCYKITHEICCQPSYYNYDGNKENDKNNDFKNDEKIENNCKDCWSSERKEEKKQEEEDRRFEEAQKYGVSEKDLDKHKKYLSAKEKYQKAIALLEE